jgi:alanine racemase
MAASSRVLDLAPQTRLRAVDVGRAVYGLLPRRGGRLGPRLIPAFARLTSALVAVKSPPGAALRVGVMPFGRAAGMACLGAGRVLVNGRRARVVGEPSLEHTRIDLSGHPRARVGDEVVIVGRQRTAEITVEDVLRAHPELPATAVGLAVGPSVRRSYRA